MKKELPRNSLRTRGNPSRTPTELAISATCFALFLVQGCASPGPPRSPSLDQPEPIKVAETQRIGPKVQLNFKLPQRNTDHLPIKGVKITVTLCRSTDNGKCLPLPNPQTYPIQTAGQPTEVLMTDDLGALAAGKTHMLSYRIDLKDIAGHSAGYSEPFFVVSGAAPAAIPLISLEGSRLGIVISWKVPVSDGEVVIRRDTLNQKSKSEPLFLTAPAETKSSQLLDDSAVTDTPYRYTAEVRHKVELGGRTITVRSSPSESAIYVLHDVYPPPVPTDLSAAVFPLNRDDVAAGLGVDLIWQPVQDKGLKGYIVYRQSVDGAKVRVTKEPVAMPAFHDELKGQGRYTYSVSAVDLKGNESGLASVSVDLAQ